MIAAVAIAQRLPLCTSNIEDFTGIDGLGVIAVPHPYQVPEQRT
jgi:predicted nucleic acid-binding protein